MSNKIYDEEVVVTSPLDALLKKTMVNHLLIYNHCLNTLYKDPEIDFMTLKRIANSYIEEKNLAPVIGSAMFNELYYQFKKFRKNVRIRKQLTDIQYLTFTVGGFDNNNFTYKTDTKEIKLHGLEGSIQLEKPLPEMDGPSSIYVNLSYSNREDNYRLNVYKYVS